MKDSRHLLIMESPARSWRDGLPCGNGRLGAMLYGNVHQDTILVNDERFYFRSKTLALPDISARFKQLRALMKERDYEKANHFFEDTLRSSGYNPHIAVFQPGFDVLLKTSVERPFTQYRRELDMAHAEARVFWNDGRVAFKKRMFVSHARNMVAFQMSASRPGSLFLEIRLDLHDTSDAVTQDGQRMEVPLVAEVAAADSHISFCGSATDGKGKYFGGVLRAVCRGGECLSHDGVLFISGADSVEFQVMTFHEIALVEAIDRTKAALGDLKGDYDTYFNENLVRHKAYYNTLDLDLGGLHKGLTNEQLLAHAYTGELPVELVEKLFHFGRYLMVSSSVPGSLPAHLQGKWNGDYDPPWQCFYMANENIQMNYWQCLTGNLLANAMPLFDYYESLIEDFRINARHLFGCRGILIPAATAPDSGLPKILHAQIIYWTGAAGWVARHFYDYYLYSGDEDFLRDRALPFMRDVAQFYEDFLVEDEDGRFQLMPSVSPENYPVEFFREWCDGGPIFISINATMEIAICRELFRNLIEGSQAAGLDEPSICRWNALLERLPEYLTAEDGMISEWVHPDFPDHENHRHLSHLYPFFPGREFPPDDPARRSILGRILNRRLTIGLQEQTGWSLVHIANIFSRFGSGEEALYCLHLLARSCIGANFLSYHNDDRRMGITMSEIWGRSPAFQIDANMGWPAAILEMLLSSRLGEVTLLPGIPPSWRKGRVIGLRAIGNIEIGLQWDIPKGRLVCQLLARKACRLAIKSRLRILSLDAPLGLEKSKWAFEDGVLELELPDSQHLQVSFLIEPSPDEPIQTPEISASLKSV